jgi:hypothetical protein
MLQKEPARKCGQLMKFKADTLASVHEQMALVKAQFTRLAFSRTISARKWLDRRFSPPQRAATARSVLLANDEYDFFWLGFFTSDLADLQQTLRDVDFPGDVVAG